MGRKEGAGRAGRLEQFELPRGPGLRSGRRGIRPRSFAVHRARSRGERGEREHLDADQGPRPSARWRKARDAMGGRQSPDGGEPLAVPGSVPWDTQISDADLGRGTKRSGVRMLGPGFQA